PCRIYLGCGKTGGLTPFSDRLLDYCEGGVAMFSSKPWKIESQAEAGAAPTVAHPLTRLRDELKSLLDGFFRRWPAPFQPGRHLEHFWHLDVQESEREVVIRAQAPGFEAGEFHVEVTGKMLSIRTDRREEAGGKKAP